MALTKIKTGSVSDSITLTTPDINGGTIDATLIGGTTPAVATFTDVVAASLDISGNIDVDGVTNLDVVDIDGAVDMASTLAVGTTIATGSGGASGKIAIAGNTATSEATHITFTNGAGAKVFAVGGGQAGVTNNGFVIRNVTDNTFPLVISDAGAATFNAGVNIGGNSNFLAPNINITADDARLVVQEADGTNMVWLGDLTGGGVGGCFLYNHGGTAVVQLRSDAASTIGHGLNVGTSSAQGRLTVRQDSTTASPLFIVNAAVSGKFASFEGNGSVQGSITWSGASTAYNTSSDYRLKEDDVPMTGATERVKALRPINFAWKVDGSRTDGFFAHEAQEIVPECATGSKDAMKDEEYEVTAAVEEVRDEDDNITTEASEAVMGTRSVPDMQGIDQSKLVPLLVAALQEAIARIEILEGA